jgi:chromosome segregation ATPase
MNKIIFTLLLCFCSLIGFAQVTQQQIADKKAEVGALQQEVKAIATKAAEFQAQARAKQQQARTTTDAAQKRALNAEAADLVKKAKEQNQKKAGVQNLLNAARRELTFLEKEYRKQQSKK